jgi:hypothetical protein
MKAGNGTSTVSMSTVNRLSSAIKRHSRVQEGPFAKIGPKVKPTLRDIAQSATKSRTHTRTLSLGPLLQGIWRNKAERRCSISPSASGRKSHCLAIVAQAKLRWYVSLRGSWRCEKPV